MGTYFSPGGPKTGLTEQDLIGRDDEYVEQAKEDHVADEVRPPWWIRLRRVLRRRSPSR
jgi:hypothetical protein